MNFSYVTLFFAVAAALAQSTAEPKPATIEGTVLNSVTKAPLRKVELSLANGGMSQEMAAMMQKFSPAGGAEELPKVATKTLTATTDAAGKFRIENVPPGTYWFTAKKVGYGDGRYPAKGGAESITLTPGQELTHADFTMVPHGTLAGRVVDEDGEPYPTAMVSAMSYRYVLGRRRLVPADMVQTNNKGEFSLGKIPPGQYVLCADAMRMDIGAQTPPPPADGSPETGYVGTYLPGVVDAAQAQKIDVAAGAELGGFQIQLRKSKVVRVSGKLTDADGAPIKTAQIVIMGGGGRVGGMRMSMVNDPQGKFEIANLQPGTYTAMTMQMQGASPKMSMQTLVVSDQNMRDVVLGARREVTLQGKVTLDGESKVALHNFPVSLAGSDGTAVMPVFAKADDGGVFTLEHVTPAAYDLNLPLSPEGTYVKAVSFNDRDALGQVIDTSAITTGTLRIVLGTDGGKVDISVSRDDKVVPNATVVLLPADPSRRFPQTVELRSTDDAGNVSMKDVPPGEYLAFAWTDIEDGIWYDPEFVKAAQGGAVRVTVRAKSSEQIQLKAISAAK